MMLWPEVKVIRLEKVEVLVLVGWPMVMVVDCGSIEEPIGFKTRV